MCFERGVWKAPKHILFLQKEEPVVSTTSNVETCVLSREESRTSSRLEQLQRLVDRTEIRIVDMKRFKDQLVIRFQRLKA